MTIPLIKYSDLLNRLVIDQQTTRELGHIHQLFVDAQSHQVMGVSCKSELLGRPERVFEWADIKSIGADSVFIHWNAGRPLELSKGMHLIVGHELWTDSGDKVGDVNDYCVNPETGEVTHYLVVANGWENVKEGSYPLPSDAIISVESKRFIIKDEAVQSAAKVN